MLRGLRQQCVHQDLIHLVGSLLTLFRWECIRSTLHIAFYKTRKLTLFTWFLQLCPLQRPIKWESVVSFSSPGAKSFSFPVVAGQTMELAVAQFWSSGMGSQESTIVDFEVAYYSQIWRCTLLDAWSFTIKCCLLFSFPVTNSHHWIYLSLDCFSWYWHQERGRSTWW